MKKGIHPVYYPEADVTCACGNTWKTGSIKKTIRTEVCSSCHPFFTGQQQRLLDMEGQVDRFYRRLQARQDFMTDKKTRDEAKNVSEHPVAELELGKRIQDALEKAGLSKIGDVAAKINEGDESFLALEGLGQKSLVDIKKKLRALEVEFKDVA